MHVHVHVYMCMFMLSSSVFMCVCGGVSDREGGVCVCEGMDILVDCLICQLNLQLKSNFSLSNKVLLIKKLFYLFLH